ncbi:MAG TPA: NAD(P)H-hydrate dehydratase [Saprospirales bacterium]|nr:NAD(P)H-hydrate dehydratase [Saprospirales bacterium]HAY70801.1 NAD(P)H-hydrate dehydratase [Saprospirales bacterium]HRQ29934.1 NAD(P)H-hydrate dehydratase [Saprospiraceae bacterium]
MRILTTEQIRAWDQFTIENEAIESIDLMERASLVFTNWFLGHSRFTEDHILIVAGTGNNGGDCLAVARMLTEKGYEVTVCICHIQAKPGRDFQLNLERLKYKDIDIIEIREKDPLPQLSGYKTLIDGIFGTGLNRPVTGYWAKFIHYINGLDARRYSIDIPSGMFGDLPNEPDDVSIEAHYCLSFEVPKLSFFFQTNSKRLGIWEARSIGLLPSFLSKQETFFSVTEPFQLVEKLITRDKFSHKGIFGHALICGGSKGMLGAALLSSKACLRSGAGMVTALVPDCGYGIVQTAAPEIMTLSGFGHDYLTAFPDLARFNAVAIGPGLGIHPDTVDFLENFLKKTDKQMVIDADALNILAGNPQMLELLPEKSILTPHPGEFRRLFGETISDLETFRLLSEKAKSLHCIIVLKGAYTAIADVDGHIYFNTTGNPGMSTAGSGDVLTGMICGLLCQGYGPLVSAQLGVYLHGLAGDLACEEKGMESMIAGDILEMTSSAFKKLHQYHAE